MVYAGILAGGTGSRMGSYTVPKQFLPLADKPMIVHVIEKFLAHPEIDRVIVGVNQEWYSHLSDITEKHFAGEPRLTVISGGSDRNGTINEIIGEIRKNSNDPEDIVVTHDAVRPFVTMKMITENIAAAREYGVCDTVISATDTIVYSGDGDFITDMPVRSCVYQGQTPQSFKVDLFIKVYSEMTAEEKAIVTDACKMFMMKGHKVKLVAGGVSNLKITYPYDYKIAQIMMERPDDDLSAD